MIHYLLWNHKTLVVFMNSFDKNLKFTVDLFENEVPHFVDLEMPPDGISIYQKDTNSLLSYAETILIIDIII